MKLLNPLEAQKQTQQRNDGDKQRLVKLQELIAQKYRELAQAEESFDKALANQKTVWDKEEKEHKQNLAVSRAQTHELEERREKALIPLTFRESELNTRDSQLSLREKELTAKEADLTDKEVALVAKFDEVSERENNLVRASEAVSVREEGLVRQEEEIRNNSALLTKSFADSTAEVLRREGVLAAKVAQNEAKEAELSIRESELNEREIKVRTSEILLRNNPFTSPIYVQHNKVYKSGIDSLDSIGGDSVSGKHSRE